VVLQTQAQEKTTIDKIRMLEKSVLDVEVRVINPTRLGSTFPSIQKSSFSLPIDQLIALGCSAAATTVQREMEKLDVLSQNAKP
jgi:hypothetical protein